MDFKGNRILKKQETKKTFKKISINWLIFIIIYLLLGILSTWWIIEQTDSQMRKGLFRNALLVSQALDSKMISDLSFEPNDIERESFRKCVEQMRQLSKTIQLSWGPAEKYIGIYSMRRKDGKILFGPESIPENDVMSSTPGTEYSDPPVELDSVFNTGTTLIVGPFTDEYGTFVSSFSPILTLDGKATGVVIGIDILLSDWNFEKIQRGAIVIGLFAIFGVMIFLITRKNRVLSNQQKILSESESRNRALLTAIPDMMFVLSRDGFFIDYNVGNYKDLPMHPETYINKHVSEVLPPELASLTLDKLEQVFQSRKIQFYEYQLEINGKLKYFEARTVFTSENSALSIIRNITEQKKAEEALKEQTELQKTLMVISNTFINVPLENTNAVINESLAHLGKYTNTDRSYIFTYDHNKRVCNNIYEWCGDGITPQIEELREVPYDSIPDWAEAHFAGKSMHIPDVSALPVDSGVRQILEPQEIKSLLALPMMDGKTCVGFVGFDAVRKKHIFSEKEQKLLELFALMLVNLLNRNKTQSDLTTAMEKAKAASKAKSEFLANMSHEIRTPMNSILGFSEVMLNTTDNSKQKSFLKTILDSGKSLLSLINDILDLSKIEAGRMEVSPEPADLRVIANEIKQIFYQKAKEKNINLIVDVDDEFPKTIVIDEIRLRQILLNLTGNALKFTNQGYVKIQIKLLRDEKGFIDFEISVIDTGIGVIEKDRNLIFESFTQQSGQDTRKYEGTGLGLTITKRLCELMNGEIFVESNPGGGSRFYARFYNIKFSDEIIEQNELFTWDEDEIIFEGSKILVVDDVSYNRGLVNAFLEDYNLQLFEAENGEMAIELCKAYDFDLVFMDIRMPGMSGYEATEKIKKATQPARIPIVALTASTMKSEIEKMELLFDGYLRKPVQKKSLINEILKFLPFQKIEKPKIEKAAGTDKETNAKPDEIPVKVKEIFRNEFSKEIETQKNYLTSNEVEVLAEKLSEFADIHAIDQLKKHTNDLKRFIESFDINSIKNCLISINSVFND